MKRRGSPTEAAAASGAAENSDREAWRRVAASVRPLGAAEREVPRSATVAVMAPAERKRATSMPVTSTPAVRGRGLGLLAVDVQPAGLDRASWRRLVQGRVLPARRLDLHGLTAAAALKALEACAEEAAASGERIIEVITGRGTGSEGGVIRRELPHWLNRPTLRPLLLGACHPHAANPGAVVLLLRRRR